MVAMVQQVWPVHKEAAVLVKMEPVVMGPTEQLSLFGEQVGLTQVITNRKNLTLKRPLIPNLQKLIESNSTDYEEILSP